MNSPIDVTSKLDDHTCYTYWSIPLPELMDYLHSHEIGLASAEAAVRNQIDGLRGSAQSAGEWIRALQLFAAQFKSPITLILIGAAVLSLFLRDAVDAATILVIVFAGAGLSFWQEYVAANAVKALLALISTKVA